ncbi:hypothetical protein B0O80DRAFT_465429 [Mortierella sp. GBAus27b]|nr:hypothetical protein BGX31_000479 [Mortierella sp. GBA43]KAI8347570.1 hypothetical protein B0O80DRAFT_465429 [Mortierella sp. GBAus27b]
MKFSIFNTIAIAACSIAVLCSTQVDAHKKKEVTRPQAKPIRIQVKCDPGMDIFCDSPQSDLDKMMGDIYSQIPNPQDQFMNTAGMTTADRRKNQMNIMKQSNLIEDVKHFFTEYVNNLKLIFQGQFDEGIFNQLKNVGSWCDMDNFVVKIVKAGLNSLSGGAVGNICDCLYPMIKNYNSFDDLVQDVKKNGIGQLLNKCTLNLGINIKDALEKASS